MAMKILSTVASILVGAFLGFITGAILGFTIGRGIDLLVAEDSFRWRTLYGSISGALAGLIAGAGTGALGIRTRFGLEWILIFSIGTIVGFVVRAGKIEQDLWLMTGIGAVAGWLVTHVARFAFRKWLAHGALETKIILVYVLIVGFVVWFVPSIMQLIGSFFYF